MSVYFSTFHTVLDARYLPLNLYMLPGSWLVDARIKGKVHPCIGTEALYRTYGPWGGRGIALLFLDHDTRRGLGVSVTPQPLFTPEKHPVPILQEAVLGPRPVRTGAENFAPTGNFFLNVTNCFNLSVFKAGDFFFPTPPHVLVNFRGFPPGCGDNAADF